VLVLSVSVVLLLREEGADRLDQPLSAPGPADEARPLEPAAPSAKLEPAPGAAPPSGDMPSQLRSSPAPRPRAVEEDRRRDQAAAEAVQAPSPAAEAPRPAPRPFAEPPGAPAESRRAVPDATQPPPQASTQEMDLGAATGVRQRAATAEREQAPASPPPAPAPDAAGSPPGRLQAGAKPAVPESSNRMEQKLRDDAAAAAPRPAWQGFERQPPEKWLERVEELRRAGRDEQAREMLAEFRRRFPQHPVPATLGR
jgi:hypothetical protein